MDPYADWWSLSRGPGGDCLGGLPQFYGYRKLNTPKAEVGFGLMMSVLLLQDYSFEAQHMDLTAWSSKKIMWYLVPLATWRWRLGSSFCPVYCQILLLLLTPLREASDVLLKFRSDWWLVQGMTSLKQLYFWWIIFNIMISLALFRHGVLFGV